MAGEPSAAVPAYAPPPIVAWWDGLIDNFTPRVSTLASSNQMDGTRGGCAMMSAPRARWQGMQKQEAVLAIQRMARAFIARKQMRYLHVMRVLIRIAERREQ